MNDLAPGDSAQQQAALHDHAATMLSGWSAPDADQDRLRSAYLAHLEAHPDGLSRDCNPDHLTASAIVVNPDRTRVLLNLHGKYRIWVQFGGHCESGDLRLDQAALREAVEESGIAALRLISSGPIQLSIHEVRCGPLRPSHHLDVRYVVEAPDDAEPVVSEESVDVRWFSITALPAVDDPLRELIAWATEGPPHDIAGQTP